MRHFQSKKINKARAGILVVFFGVFSCGFAYLLISPNSAAVAQTKTSATPRGKIKANTQQKTPAKQAIAEFPHSKHQMECGSCHKFPSANWEKVRKTDAFPDVTDYPKHESCLDCHREQFFKGDPPAICTICHTNPSPNDSSRHPFPNPREIFDQSPKGKSAVSDFQVSFPHDKHIDIVSEYKPERIFNGAMFVSARMRRADGGEESCIVCHKTYQPQGDSDDEYVTKPPAKLGDAFWLKKGTFKTVPTGHATCFPCHSQDSGLAPAPTDCGTCHKLASGETVKADFDAKQALTMGISDKIMLTAWRNRDSSGTFRHEWFSHAELKCTSCHNAAAINTLAPLTKKVSVTSCSGCHITATSDDGGILNYEIDSRKKDAKFECVKCHVAFGKSPIPDSHFKAVAGVK